MSPKKVSATCDLASLETTASSDEQSACSSGSATTYVYGTGALAGLVTKQTDPDGDVTDTTYYSSGFAARQVRTVTTQQDGRYPSDHFPVVADLRWPRHDRAH